MKYWLIFVIILNAMNTVSIFMRTISSSETVSFAIIGRSIDNSLWPLSIIILALAVMKIYPKSKTAPLD